MDCLRYLRVFRFSTSPWLSFLFALLIRGLPFIGHRGHGFPTGGFLPGGQSSILEQGFSRTHDILAHHSVEPRLGLGGVAGCIAAPQGVKSAHKLPQDHHD